MEIIQVDAFTAVRFRGNPAAVCVLERERADTWLQEVAREMNLSETAFLRSRDDGWLLRWFTPAVEVELCGHATLASAHVLWETGLVPSGEIATFHTRSGVLRARQSDGWIVMDFPAEVPEAVDGAAAVADALGVAATFIARNRFDYLVEVAAPAAVTAARPDMKALRALGGRGVILTARSETGEHDFVSRFFAPAAGVDEDPVTGSAHCALAPYWAGRLGRSELLGYQASERGGVVRVQWNGGDRVELQGQAVTVMRCQLIDGGGTDE